ncbi:hypothetical protein QWY93_01695 [Echinicola jeungdonensis]|uniref:Tetratricopeptide repeat protein n=1 Tax=Echinicola jeungdonensis TaxID=709343 RepID=A0ABV5J648_9BACT|nr:hypothetical protein [Echinicola jeungdonensis]MDN3668049.1 hypothetical protein [Echinicola jeungdonensis]
MNKTAGQQITVENDPLILFKDSVQAVIKASIPSDLVTEKTNYYLLPEFQYGEGALPLEDIKVNANSTGDKDQPIELTHKIIFPYQEGMDRGVLRVKGLLEDKENQKTYSTSYINLAQGIISTPTLVQVGQFAPGEAIPQVGAYMRYNEEMALSTEPVEMNVYFPSNEAIVSDKVSQSNEMRALKNFIANHKDIKGVSITGMTAPEPSELQNSALADQRGQALAAFIREELKKNGYGEELDNIRFVLGTQEKNWLQFRQLLRTYDQISVEDKEKYFDVIYSDKPYFQKVTDLEKVVNFGRVKRDIFPKLRMAKVTFLVEKNRRPDPEISAYANQYIHGTAGEKVLTEGELAYAAEFNPGLKEKQALYEEMIQRHGSALAFNNLGVVYLNQAHRMIKVSERNQKVAEAINMFEKSNDINKNAYALHNLGQAYLMWEDYAGAYIAISEANAISQDNPDFNRFNEGKRGAIDIIRGDYKLATVRLDKAPDTDINLFNKGLAHYLAEEYGEAAIAFEESAMSNMEYAYPFYGLALVAAKNNDEERLYENLAKAVQRSPYLKRRAATDLEFEKYQDKAAFRQAIR